MSEKLEVSFNSPQCGWMSVGFSVGEREFHTTTAHAPHERALPQLLRILSDLLAENNAENNVEKTLNWNRDPEEFDFVFRQEGQNTSIEIIEFPTGKRNSENSQLAFSYDGGTVEICRAFYKTFKQLYAEREADEFEQNWRQPFPIKEFIEFETKVNDFAE